MARFVGPCLLVLLLACTRRNPGFDELIASSSSTSATSTTAAASTGEPTTSGPGTTIDPVTPGSSDTGGTVGLTDSGTGTSEALSTTGPDPTTGSPDTTTSTTSSSESSSSSETGAPEPEHLQFYEPDRCDLPLWCFKGGNLFDGANARTGSQVCFDPTTPAPYGLTRIGYRIVARFGDLSPDTKLQVHERTDSGPGPLLLDLPLSEPELSVGPHARLLDPPLEIGSAGFCVGLLGGRINPGAGLGVAVDVEALGPKQSYLRIEGGVGCNFGWKDVDAIAPNPEGAWCIDAEVVPL